MRIFTSRSTVARALLLLPVAVLMMPLSVPAGGKATAAKQELTQIATPAKSEFTTPQNPGEGSDPFFPNANYLQTDTPVFVPVPVPDRLKLKAISGTKARPLAIINDRTFAIGDTADVRTSHGRISVTCLDIDIEGLKVRVKTGSETSELSMPGKS